MTQQDQYNELSYYTLAHAGKDFIHQHFVDAYTAQTADEKVKPIAIFFALAGLYLFTIKKNSGRQVQSAHLKMAKKTKDFVRIILPDRRGEITIDDVLRTTAGSARDEMIKQWCISVWNAFSKEHDKVIMQTEKLLAN